MPSTRDIKRRQRSVKNTGQVTRAMQMVAASKMRKAQLTALQSRPYAQKALSILAGIKHRHPELKNPFLDEAKETNKIIALVVASDKGLCGGLNGAVIRESQKLFDQYKKYGYEIELILVGVKSKPYFEKMGVPILEVFKGAGDFVDLAKVLPIAEFMRARYASNPYKHAVAIYTEFISTLKQRVSTRKILPIGEYIFEDLIRGIAPETGRYSGKSPVAKINDPSSSEYIFEPEPQAVLEKLIPFLLNIYIYHIILESNASEHSARMVAMKNATDSAKKILSELTLSYNKARQAAITKEITEISAGVEALKNF